MKNKLILDAEEQKSFESFFMDMDFNIEDNNLLRTPQKEAYLRAQEFLKSNKKSGAIIQIPVGCGKTGLASILPFGIAKGRVVVIAPNLIIKDSLYEAMDVTNRQKCFWRKSEVLSSEQMASGPFACTLDSGNISTTKKSHITITNVQQLATNADKWLTQFPDNFFDLIIVDEAHHSAANSWKKVIARFPHAKVILLTATPFRSDRQQLDGEFIYRYSFRSATLKGYIKRLKASYIAPEVIELEFSGANNKTYTLDEVLKLKEEDWFSRSIALSRPCNQNIVNNSLDKLEELRLSGSQHQLIAVACTINHANEIRSLYEERGYTAAVIHSKQKTEEQELVLANLRNGTLDCIIQVQMLGEGFDHPKLSVAAIFRPFRSLAPYIQFVGRIMRVVVQNAPNHPDNIGHIVTHLGMNIDQRLKEFKEFENDDQKFWEKVIGGEELITPEHVAKGDAKLRATEQIIVHDEIIEALWEEDFTSLDDDQIIADLMERMKLYGLEIDKDKAVEIVQKAKASEFRKISPAEPFLIQPQKEWGEAKKRLYEQGQHLAKILLNNAGLEMTGTELVYKYKSLGLSGRNNFICALALVQNKINKKLGKPRGEASTEEFRAILDNLDGILDPLVRMIKKVQADYDKENP